jgi:RNA polymerase sigma-70 factor, ECF subfamily
MAYGRERVSQSASSLGFGIEAGKHGDGLSAFSCVRTRLFSIAYRMLGSVADAEDIVQDVWLLWQCTNRSVVQNPSAFLATTATRLCINLVQCAYWRREICGETGHPDPVATSSDPASGPERSESLRLAMLVLLEKLSPSERAAYILREAFDYSYRQIADVIGMEEANSRQLVSRARKHIANGRRAPVSARQQRRLLKAFIAAQQGNMTALEDLFAEDVVCYRTEMGLCADSPQFPAPGVWRGSPPSSLHISASA